MAALAQKVADGATVAAAGCAMGMTETETASIWRAIKRDLGAQAK